MRIRLSDCRFYHLKRVLLDSLTHGGVRGRKFLIKRNLLLLDYPCLKFKRLRLINRICEKSLMYGCQQNLRIIDDQDVIYVSEHEMLRGGEQS